MNLIPTVISTFLREVSLPAAPSPRFWSGGTSGHAALRNLVLALAGLPNLRRINGVDLAAVRTSVGDVDGGGPSLDLAGYALGPLGAGVVMAQISSSASQPKGPRAGGAAARGTPGGGPTSSLVAVNLTGCAIGAEGAEQLAAAVGEGGFGPVRRACLADNRLGASVS